VITWFRRLSWPKRLLVLGSGGFLLVVVVVVLGYLFTDVPTPNKIATDQSTTVAYLSGSPIGNLGKNRQIVPLKDISKDAQHAVLAAEDRDFYTEPGISVKGIGRALFKNVQAGGVQQGGSTITQQYAKNAFLTQQRTFSRKIKEVFIAVKMSQTVSKDQILEDYLNTIYFGRGAYGIQAAARTYFRTDASKLTAAQAAVLASSIRSPAGYDPQRHPKDAKQRWEFVLDGMVKKGWLSDGDRPTAYPRVWPRSTDPAFPGTLDYVKDQVIAELGQHGFDESLIESGGLWVQTTIDKNAELAAIKAEQEQVEAFAEDKKNPPVSALVSIEPGSGRVVAYYGGKGGGFDYASDGRVLPGSSMKPYVLATALSEGKSLRTQYDGSSPQTVCGQLVHNDEGDPPFGSIDLATGLQYSVNTVYLHLACDVGPKKVRALAQKAGLADDPLDGEGSVSAQIALGSGGYGVRPIDQADGYATFAAQGVQADPYFVEAVYKVKDGKPDLKNGRVYQHKVKRSTAFSQDVAADATSAMVKVVQAGTGTNAQLDGRPTAGKTGTTSNNTNAWFCGFTPQLATAVWIGNAHGGTVTLGGKRGIYGGTVPAKIFKQYMEVALDGKPVKQFPKAANTGSVSTPSAPVSTATTTATATASPTATATKPPVVPTSPPPVVPTVVATSAPPPSTEPTATATPPTASQAASPGSSP
jgi:membrane peptidoglycan carboxypeptidase